MAKRRFKLTEKQEKELNYCYSSSKEALLRTRCQAVRLYGEGYEVQQILNISGCSRTSLMEWVQKYQQAGVEGLQDHRLGGNSAKLSPEQQLELEERLRSYTPGQLFGPECHSPDGQFWTVADLQQLLQGWYGISYKSRSSYHNLFERCGFSYQRSSKLYNSRSEHKVADFMAILEKKLLDVVQKQPQTAIVAEDEASLYLQATTSAAWAPQGQTPLVRVHPGREKTCFYGSLELRTGQETVLQTDKMTSETTLQHLQQLLERYPDLPILLLWDRAKWHYGQPVRDFLKAQPRLQVLYFPPASPDLNPQEHVWKATRKAVSHHHLVQKLSDLVVQFLAHLTSTSFPSSFLETFGFSTLCPFFI